MNEQVAVSIIFVLTFAGIISEKLEKSVVALLGALAVILGGFLTFHEATESIDFNTIGLLLGMMLIVEVLREIKIFDWLALRLTISTKGDPVIIFVAFSLITAIMSAFLDNVTTVLINVPLVIALTEGMGLNPRPYVLSLIFMSNLGGSITLIGDPPNILIGSKVAELTFIKFIQYLILPGLLSTFAAMLFLKWRYASEVRSRKSDLIPLFMSQLVIEDVKRRLASLELKRDVVIKAAAAFGITILGFFSHPITHIEPAVVAILGAVIFLALFKARVNFHHTVARIEWPTLLFFSGLFIVVHSLESAGVLRSIANLLVSVTSSPLILMLLILWVSAMLSAIVDNIPFVAVMIPVLQGVSASEQLAADPNRELLWWALALGACYGGNGTAIGASANVVSCAISSSRGYGITFRQFLRDSIPTTIISVVIASLYLTALYYM